MNKIFEAIINILRSSLKILNTEYIETGNSQSDLVGMAVKVKQLMVMGATVTQTLNGVTPLMIYAACDITDDRFKSLMHSDDSADVAITKMTIRVHNTTGISALTIAAIAGSLNSLKILYSTGLFSQEHIEEAVFIAAMYGQAGSVNYLKSVGIDLFKRCLFQGINALHVACIMGHHNVVKAIIDTDPSEQQISMPTRFPANTAYELAVYNQHEQCAQLLKNIGANIAKEKVDAIKAQNIPLFMQLFKSDKSTNPFLTNYFNGYQSFIAIMALFSGDEAKAALKELLTLLINYPIDIQVSTLLNTLKTIYDCTNEKAISNEVLELIELIDNRLDVLQDQYSEIKNIRISILFADKKVMLRFIDILHLTNPSQIDLGMCSPDIYDEEIQDACAANIWNGNYIVSIIAANLANTNLIECNLQSVSKYQIFIELLEVVMKRNREMGATESEAAKDKIYNQYALKINSMIIEIKQNHVDIMNIDDLQPLIMRISSLKSLSVFFIATNLANSEGYRGVNILELDSMVDSQIKSIKKLEI